MASTCTLHPAPCNSPTLRPSGTPLGRPWDALAQTDNPFISRILTGLGRLGRLFSPLPAEKKIGNQERGGAASARDAVTRWDALQPSQRGFGLCQSSELKGSKFRNPPKPIEGYRRSSDLVKFDRYPPLDR